MKSRKHRYWHDIEHPDTFAELISNISIEAADDIIWSGLRPRLEMAFKAMAERGVPQSIISDLESMVIEIIAEAIVVSSRLGYGLASTPIHHNSFEEWANVAIEKAGLLDYETGLCAHFIRNESEEAGK